MQSDSKQLERLGAHKLGFLGDGSVEGGDGGQCAEGAVNIFVLCLYLLKIYKSDFDGQFTIYNL